MSLHQIFHSLTLLQVLRPQVPVEKSSDFGGIRVSKEPLTLKKVWMQMIFSVNPLVSVDLLRVQDHGLALSESPCGSDNH